MVFIFLAIVFVLLQITFRKKFLISYLSPLYTPTLLKSSAYFTKIAHKKIQAPFLLPRFKVSPDMFSCHLPFPNFYTIMDKNTTDFLQGGFMNYQSQLDFFIKILKSFNLPCHLISYPFDDVPDMDLGIRRLIDPDREYQSYLDLSLSSYPGNKLYYALDEYGCNYIFLQLPDTNPVSYLFIGPYLTTPFETTELYQYADKFSVPPGLIKQVEHYYRFLPLITDTSSLRNIIISFAEHIWGSVDNFTIEFLENSRFAKTNVPRGLDLYEENDFPTFSVKRIEERYEQESQFILAVSQGKFIKAEKFLVPYAFTNLEQRTAESLRNEKNYTIILNTLLRKAAELGSVHPYHIDAISSRFARRIETVTSIKEVELLQREMVHKYCLLVKNHSMKGYSLLVRKILTLVDTDITADLTLNTLANELNVNSSYLSTLFKKETGSTLTEYVNRKRIEHAILLLNSTNMQIQMIAQHCGIADVNYFTKLFKKQIGKTPKEYRESLYPLSHKK